MIAQDAALYPDAAAASAADAVDAAARGRGARVARNITVVLAAQLAIWVGASGLGVLLPRYLGDASIGRLTFAISLVSFGTAFVLFGSDTYLAREVARRPDRAGHLTFNALAVRLPMLLIALLGVVAFMHAFRYPSATREVVYVVSGTMCIGVVSTTLAAVLQGLERMTLTSATGIVERLISGAVGVGAVALAGVGLMGYALILVGSSGVACTILLVYFLRTIGISFRLDLGVCRALFRGGAPFMFWSLALMIYGTIDITMLSIMTRDEVVGWYGTAYRFIGIASFFPSAITMALLPNISNAGIVESRPLIRRCMDLAMLLSVALAVFFFVGARAIIDFLGYPAGFSHTVILLRILSLHIPLTTFAMIAGVVVVAANREGPRTKAAIGAAVLNPLANLVAIPYFAHSTGNGAIGAAITSVLIEVFMTTVMFTLLPAGTLARANLDVIVRALGAGAAMGAAMVLASPYGLIPMTLLGGAAFAVTAILVRAISVRELIDVASTVARRRAAA